MVDSKENSAPWIVLVSHGRFAEQLLQSAQMIMGKLKDVQTYGLVEGESPADLEKRIRRGVQEIPDNSIILVDLFGGTPSNVVARIAKDRSFSIVTGMNLGMLIQAEMLRVQKMPSDSTNVSEQLVKAGQEGVLDLQAKLAGMTVERSEL